MKVFIHTRGRAGNVKTLDNIPDFVLKNHFLVVRKDEEELYREAHPKSKIIVLPKKVDGLSATRQWLLDYDNDSVFVMLDDDITGYSLKPFKDSWKMQPASDRQVDTAWRNMLMHGNTGKYGIVSMVDRFSASRLSSGWLENQFTWKIFVINRRIIKKTKARFDRVLIAQDVDMVLQLFRAGVKTMVSVMVSMNSPGIDAKGGCSIYRTDKLRVQEYKKLETLHPGLCEVRMKFKDGREMPVLHKFWKKAKIEGGLIK